ncbi:DUF1611 domain-containing protein [Thalassospira sp. TSL5-1]|uniref:DUF1611 domain-containing protein n=1 Tax=Thalassospira sp. TSL5-1 TaxID=1544451 RepID=UPI0009F8DEAA|nr:DUF1611 domain-containing protein [Thalassospira sp. TSL5-1]
MTIPSFAKAATAQNVIQLPFNTRSGQSPVGPTVLSAYKARPTAIVYCEANFGLDDGKTANGLVRHSEKYDILSVIDSTQTGRDTGVLLDGKANGIPVLAHLDAAFEHGQRIPNYFIYGMAPATGMLSVDERDIVLDALNRGLHVVNGLHEFLNDDPEFVLASQANNVDIIDIRKPRPKNDLRLFTGNVSKIPCPRIAVLGTDCAIGKRTTASILTRALIARGIKAVMVTTGQTGMMQGSKYGVALDAVPSQFCCGELEATVIEAYEGDHPDIIIVEGQGALSHPAFCTSAFILRGCTPDGVILQHAPNRVHRCDFDQMPMPSPESEIRLIEAFSDTRVIGLTINHENMTDAEIGTSITAYHKQLGIPVTDALARPVNLLVDMVLSSFPALEKKLSVTLQ